jgi:hypothetical protein
MFVLVGGIKMPKVKTKIANFKPFESRKTNSKHIRITEDMTTSEAWGQLDPYDITAYMRFKRKYYVRSDQTDNSKNISLTYKEMGDLMSPDRFKKCVDNLLRVGLIDIENHKPQTRDATIYSLSTRWHKYGTEGFVEKKRPKFTRKRKNK